VCKDLPARKVRLAHKVTKETLVQPVQCQTWLVQLVQLDLKVLRVLQVRKDQLALLAQLDQLVHREMTHS
jgi:hypothetical protein